MLTFSCRWLGRRGSLERWLSDKGQPCLVTVSHTPETLPAAPCHSGTALWMQVLLLRTWGYGTEVTPVQPLRIMLCPSNSLVFCPSELDKHFLCFLFHLQLTIIYKSVIHILFLSPYLLVLSLECLAEGKLFHPQDLKVWFYSRRSQDFREQKWLVAGVPRPL